MRWSWILVLAACSTTSHAGAFVTDVDVAASQLLVETCDLELEVTNFNGRTEEMHASQCSSEQLDLPATSARVLAAPGGCGDAVAMWQSWERDPGSPDERRKAWRRLPERCRAYLEAR